MEIQEAKQLLRKMEQTRGRMEQPQIRGKVIFQNTA
jgi:hypothetical protein